MSDTSGAPSSPHAYNPPPQPRRPVAAFPPPTCPEPPAALVITAMRAIPTLFMVDYLGVLEFLPVHLLRAELLDAGHLDAAALWAIHWGIGEGLLSPSVRTVVVQGLAPYEIEDVSPTQALWQWWRGTHQGAETDPHKGAGKRRRKRGGQVKGDPTADAKLYDDWQAAKRQGQRREPFALAKGINLSDLNQVLDRERKRRKSPAE